MNLRARIGLLVQAQGARRAATDISGVAHQVDRVGDKAKKSGRQMAIARQEAALFSRGLRRTASAAKYGAIAVAGLGAVAIKGAIDEYREAYKTGKQTNAVIESTGGAANVTQKQVEGLAEAISLKAGIDDEAIQRGQNLLLTFTNIRNEVGEGNDIFDQATQAATDMSVALGQDMKSSAIQLGKALNDPTKGITALQRVGVSFTQDQKDMVANWVKHGQTLKAQKFILAELNREFAGSAKAQADPADRARVAWQNLQETLGRVLAPTVEKVATAFATFIQGMQDGTGAGGKFARILKNYVFPAVKWLVGAVRDAAGWLIQAFKDVRDWVVKHWPTIRTVLKAAAWPITNVLVPALNTLKDIAVPVFGAIKDAVVWVVNAVKDAINWIDKMIDKLRDTPVGDLLGAVGIIDEKMPEALAKQLREAGVTLPGMAAGGTVSHPGSALVGENGPELLTLPRGAEVRPLDGLGGLAGLLELHVHSHLDGREVGHDIRRVSLRDLAAGSAA